MHEYYQKLSNIYRVGKGLADITESFALSSLCLTLKLYKIMEEEIEDV
ncbi:hypothetical protein [Clostridium folliculivorans]|nr:hypothetical protein [Clostridium folliculivorans]